MGVRGSMEAIRFNKPQMVEIRAFIEQSNSSTVSKKFNYGSSVQCPLVI